MKKILLLLLVLFASPLYSRTAIVYTKYHPPKKIIFDNMNWTDGCVIFRTNGDVTDMYCGDFYISLRNEIGG